MGLLKIIKSFCMTMLTIMTLAMILKIIDVILRTTTIGGLALLLLILAIVLYKQKKS